MSDMSNWRFCITLDDKTTDMALIGSLIIAGATGIRLNVRDDSIEQTLWLIKQIRKAIEFTQKDIEIWVSLSELTLYQNGLPPIQKNLLLALMQAEVDYLIIPNIDNSQYYQVLHQQFGELMYYHKQHQPTAKPLKTIVKLTADNYNSEEILPYIFNFAEGVLLTQNLSPAHWQSISKACYQYVTLKMIELPNEKETVNLAACQEVFKRTITSGFQGCILDLLEVGQGKQAYSRQFVRSLTDLHWQMLQQWTTAMQQAKQDSFPTLNRQLNKTAFDIALKSKEIKAMVLITDELAFLNYIVQQFWNEQGNYHPIDLKVITSSTEVVQRIDSFCIVDCLKVDKTLYRSIGRNQLLGLQTLMRAGFLQTGDVVVTVISHTQPLNQCFHSLQILQA